MKKIIIILISLVIIGIIIFLYIDNINMNYEYYINDNNISNYHVSLDSVVTIEKESVNELIQISHSKLASLQKRNTILYTILLALAVTDTTLIFTTKKQ